MAGSINITVTNKEPINVSLQEVLYQTTSNNDPNSIYLPTAIDIGVHRVVAVNNSGELIYADNTDLDTMNRVIGVSLQSVSAGGNCKVLRHGEIEDQSFNFIGDNLYVGATGAITTTPPNVGYSQIIGTIITLTKIYIDINEPLQLI